MDERSRFVPFRPCINTCPVSLPRTAMTRLLLMPPSVPSRALLSVLSSCGRVSLEMQFGSGIAGGSRRTAGLGRIGQAGASCV